MRTKSMVLALTACLGMALPAVARIAVVTTTTDLAAIAREVGGDEVTVESIMTGRDDPHHIQLKPSDMLKVRRAQVLVKVGLALDFWIQPVMEAARNNTMLLVDASQGVSVLQKPTGGLDPTRGDIHPQGNPHYWLDPYNGTIIAHNIALGLAKIDPPHAPAYFQREKAFDGRLVAALTGWLRESKAWSGTKVITYHASWIYFMQRFGLDGVATIEDKPGIPPSAAHVATLDTLMTVQRIRMIFQEPYFPVALGEQLAARHGAKFIVLAPSVNGQPGTGDYLTLFDHHVRAIKALLGT